MRLFFILIPILLALSMAGCTRVPLADDGMVSSTVENRINAYAPWYQDYCDTWVDDELQCLLYQELTADSAIQIALLNNPEIQAFYEEIGMARADLVEAGLLTNPAFDIEIRFPPTKSLHTDIEYAIVTSLLDIFLVPLRVRLATTEFEQTKLKVSNKILELAFDVRQTYFELISELEKVKYVRSNLGLAQILYEIVSKQNSVGNVFVLELQVTQSKLLEAEIEFAQVQNEVIRLKEKLNRLLGLEQDHCLLFPEFPIFSIDYEGFDICILESVALAERLDLQIAYKEIQRLSQRLGLKDWWTYTFLKGGFCGEREDDGTNLMGPTFSGEIPIFNYGQAARMHIFSQLRQNQNKVWALEIQILSEVREAHKLLMNNLEIITTYRNQLLPMQKNILSSTEELYNIMGIGINELLVKKQMEITLKQNLIESIKRYLVARVALDRALGGYLHRLIYLNHRDTENTEIFECF